MIVMLTLMTVWQSPSGRMHGMAGCSGAGPRNRQKQRKITREQFVAADRCRCLPDFRNTELKRGETVYFYDDEDREVPGTVVQVGDSDHLRAPDDDMALIRFSRTHVTWVYTEDLVKGN